MAFNESVIFQYTGSQQTWTKPVGVSSFYFIVKGGGGGGGNTSNTSSGGGGAYVFTNYNYLNPNIEYDVYINVGGGGKPPPTYTGGISSGGQNSLSGFYESNGGNGSTLISLQSGGGGGMTTIFDISGTSIKIIAGGGGGAGNNSNASGGDSDSIGVNGSGTGGGQGGNTSLTGNSGLGGINGGVNGYMYANSTNATGGYIFQGGGGGSGGTFAGGGGGAGYGGGAGGRQGGGGGGGSFSLPIARTIFIAGGGGAGGTIGQAGQNGSVEILWNSDPLILPDPYVEMFMLNSQHTCKSIYSAPTILPSDANIYSYLTESTTFPNSAVINSNGYIYIVAGDGKLYAFNEDLSFRWIFTAPTNYTFIGTPALTNNLTLYIAATTTTTQNYLFAVVDNGSGNDTGGAIKWQFPINGNSSVSPVIDLDDNVYIGTDNGYLYAIQDAFNQGLSQWPGPYRSPDDTNKAITGSPVFDISYSELWYSASNTITGQSAIIKLILSVDNTELPTQDWRIGLNGYYGTISIDPVNNDIYVPVSLNNRIHKYDYTGNLVWNQLVFNNVLSSIAIDTDYIYFTTDTTLTVLDKTTGAIEWRYYDTGEDGYVYTTVSSIYNSIPIIDANNNVIFGARTGYLYSIDPLQRIVNWKYQTGGSIQCMPVINEIGNILFGSNDGYIYDLSGNGVPRPTTTPIVAMYMLNTEHTGQSSYESPINKPQQIWATTHINCGNLFVLPSITIATDGTLYLGSDDGYAYALNPIDGNVKSGWPVSMINTSTYYILNPNSVYLTPLIAPDGTIYFGTNQGYFYALNPNGTIKWYVALNNQMQSSPIIDANGTIYFGVGTNVYAIGDDGINAYLKWSTVIAGGYINSSPALGQNGYLYVGSDNGNVYALNNLNGSVVWTYDADDGLLPAGAHPIYSSPTIDASNNVLICNGSNMDGVLYYLDGTAGTLLWTYPDPPQSQTGSSTISPVGPFYNTVAIKDNTVYLSTMTYVYSINRSDGTENWRFYKASCYYSSAIIDNTDNLLFTGIDARTNHGILYSLSDQGNAYTENWSYDSGDVGRLSAPTLGNDGTIYLSSNSQVNKIYALRYVI
jgi:outer membrane protein assembly factor BamB